MALHPIPQMARERWLDLCGPWQFTYDDEDLGLHDRWMDKSEPFDRTIIVPFPPESPLSGIDDNGFHPIVWYRRTFQLQPEDQGKQLILHFGAVDYRAQVWVNGQMVAEHEGGNTPFSADITNVLVPDQDQAIVVRAVDMPRDLAQPRGKQYWELQPRDIWYKRTTGIWQPVWIEPVSPTHITELRWTPDIEHGQLILEARVNKVPTDGLKMRVRLYRKEVLLADDLYSVRNPLIRRALALESQGLTMDRKRLLWSPERPNLIDAVVTLEDGDETVDEVRSYTGLRSVGYSDGRFQLNGRPYYLRLVLEQGYWPESNLAAPSEEALRREVELAKSLGFNGVRLHQHVADPRFLYWCDKLGLVVWGEMANAYVFSRDAMERLIREWIEVLRRDYSHPCIVTWVPLNESWGVPDLEHDPLQRDFVRSVYYLTHSLDPTRLVIGNDGWEHVVTDIVGIHDYALNGEVLRERYGTRKALEETLRETRPHYHTIALPGYQLDGQPVMITEFGGISYKIAPDQPWLGYGTVSTRDEYLAKYDELVSAVLDSTAIAGFCYTQLTDTGQETNGLLTEDREPKLDPAAVHEITSRPSRAVPGEILQHVQMATQAAVFQTEQV